MDYMQVLEYYSITKVQDGEKPLSPEKLPLGCLEFHLDNKTYYLSAISILEGIGDTRKTMPKRCG